MEAAKMKPLLALSKREPIQAAVALTADGEGVVLLDKRLKPKKVLAQLKALAGKAKIQLQPSTLRFGKAEVDTEYDPGMVRFFVNKEAPGAMRAKLVVVFKQIAYSKVEFNVDASFEDEADEEEGRETTAASAPTTTTAAPPPPAPPPPALDAKALTTSLGQLVQAIPKVAAGNDALQKSLVAIAAAAQGSLKTNDLAKASEGIDALRHALAAALEQAKQKAGAGAAPQVDWRAIRQTWQSASDAVDQQITALQAALRKSGDDTLEEIAEFGVNGVTGNHKVRLMAAMMELGSGDPAAIAKSGRATLALVRDFRAYLDSDERVLVCDENPFGVAVSLRATFGGALTQIEAALQNAA
jgi:hypothetical protein